jgi:tRNA-splicing ligase RtcB
MKTDGIIYADEKLEKMLETEAIDQVANVATLPEIVGNSLAMPDIHTGYGFPIGGVAAFDAEEGIISPGGVGYDINCLSPDTKIMLEHGCYLTIQQMEKKWNSLRVVCVDFKQSKEISAEIVKFIKLKPNQKVFKLTTTAGDEIIATGDHPFWTPDGMLKAEYLKMDGKIAINSFIGVEYEEPSDEIILNEQIFENLKISLDKRQIIKELKKRNLLPLKMNDYRLPFILKIIGYHMGDGIMYISKNKAIIWFYGQPEELELIRQDIFKIGYTPSKIYTRERKHSTATTYKTYEFTNKEYSIKVTSRSFLALLLALGVPMGKKVYQSYFVPEWVFNLKKWQKRLFLVGLFDAELSSPKSLYNYNFHAPCLSMNKEGSSINNGTVFMNQIKTLLNEFGVQTQKIGKRKERKNKQGKDVYRFRIIISSEI